MIIDIYLIRNNINIYIKQKIMINYSSLFNSTITINKKNKFNVKSSENLREKRTNLTQTQKKNMKNKL